MSVDRRLLLTGAAAVGLASCAALQQNPSNNPATVLVVVVAAVQGVAADAVTFLRQLQTVQPPPSWLTNDLISKVSGIVTQLDAAAGQIEGVASLAAAQPLIQQIETLINELVSVAATMPLPPPISMYVQMAALALPILEAIVGLVIPPPVVTNATAAAAKASAIRSTYLQHPVKHGR